MPTFQFFAALSAVIILAGVVLWRRGSLALWLEHVGKLSVRSQGQVKSSDIRAGRDIRVTATTVELTRAEAKRDIDIRAE